MTPNTTAARTAKTARFAGLTEAEQLLRDAAFVLKLTRRVKDDILRDAAGPNRPTARRPDATPAALGV